MMNGEIRRLNGSHLTALLELQKQVLSELPHPDALRVDSADYLAGNLGEAGFTFGAFEGKMLIAYASLRFQDERCPEHLGRDLELPESELASVGLLDGSGVHPAYRGLGLQRALSETRKVEALRQGARHFAGTVSPFNPFSLDNFLKSGMLAKGFKLKYGGMSRILIYESVKTSGTEKIPSSGGRWVDLSDLASVEHLLKTGWIGTAVLRLGIRAGLILYPSAKAERQKEIRIDPAA